MCAWSMDMLYVWICVRECGMTKRMSKNISLFFWSGFIGGRNFCSIWSENIKQICCEPDYIGPINIVRQSIFECHPLRHPSVRHSSAIFDFNLIIIIVGLNFRQWKLYISQRHKLVYQFLKIPFCCSDHSLLILRILCHCIQIRALTLLLSTVQAWNIAECWTNNIKLMKV